MAKAILTVVLVILLNVLVGCHPAESGRSRLIPRQETMTITAPLDITGIKDIDIIERMAFNRQAYMTDVHSLMAYYKKTGDNIKYGWAKDELNRLEAMPQYDYLIIASIAPPSLRATNRIADAELIYIEGRRLEKKAKAFPPFTNRDEMRLALDKYEELIEKHPSSDRIDDAAYRAGAISNYFKDYSIALIYYQRTYQWNADTRYPARYKAAYILDKRLSRRDEALDLYRASLEKEKLAAKTKEFVQERINYLAKSSVKLKDIK